MAAVVITHSCQSRTDSPDGGTDIATLVRRALAEVCTVPVLLVFAVFAVILATHYTLLSTMAYIQYIGVRCGEASGGGFSHPKA